VIAVSLAFSAAATRLCAASAGRQPRDPLQPGSYLGNGDRGHHPRPVSRAWNYASLIAWCAQNHIA
jgi:hypothetical protein